MWLLVSNSNGDEKYPILGDKKYVVGRMGCDIIINDPSVSRKQAALVMAHYEANVVKSFITPSLTLEDTSKFGTMVNGESIKKKPGCMVTLKDGDKIQFGGAPASVYTAVYKPFVATTSCLEKVPKKNLQRVMCLLGGHVVREWRASCDLLIMAKINVTIKVICAINNQKPIVTPDYLDHYHQSLTGERDSKPDPKDYLPEVVDKEVPAGVSFHPDIRRATLLKDLKFYFLSAHQFNKTNLAVSTAGGLPILLEDGTEEDADVMTQDGTIVVAVSRDVLSSLSPTCQKFVRTVCLVLKKKNLRMVTDPEIGWAILTCNTDDFCNPQSAITPSMYSSMASQSLSQMTEMDDLHQYTNTLHMQHAADSAQQQRAGERAEKRLASAMDQDEKVSPEKMVIEDSSSVLGPADKRIKPEPLVSPSQQSLFGTENSNSALVKTEPESAAVFKLPQAPLSPVNKGCADLNNSGENNQQIIEDSNFAQGNGGESRLRSTETNKALKKGGNYENVRLSSINDQACVTDKSHRGIDANDHENGNSVELIDNDTKTDPSLDLIETSFEKCNNVMQKSGLSSPHSKLTGSGSKKVKNSGPSPSGFLSKKGNSSNASFEDMLHSEKDPPSSLSSSSTKGKRKKRALFCDDSDEDDGGVSSSSTRNKRNKLNTSVRDENIDNNDDDHIMHNRVTENIVNDTPSVSMCNGDATVHRINGSSSVVMKEEKPSQSPAVNGTIEVVPQPTPVTTSWTTVKKEEDQTGDEQKVNMEDLVLDSDGQPLRHLCQVKVVELVARVPKSCPGSRINSQCHQANAKNFKRFKKTVHCGGVGLPTIIGGHDLEPHNGTRFNQIEGLLSEVGGTQNGMNVDNERDAMFAWQEDDVVDKRRTKRK